MRELDDAATRWLNARVRALPTVAGAVGAAAQGLAGVEIGLMLLLALSGRRRSAVRMLLSVTIVYVAIEAAGRRWPRQRPFERVHGVEALVAHSNGRSFPSRHVASGITMAVIGAQEHARLGRTMASVAWLLGATRVAAGLHYPSDVAAGALLGQAIGYILKE